MRLLILLFVSGVSFISAFQITQFSHNSGFQKPGGTLNMICKTDQHWEYCSWRHKVAVNSANVIRECHMEWKRLQGRVLKQACHPEITNRVKITGDYNNYECGIQIENLNEADTGEWECELEAYVLLGGKGSGATRNHTFDIIVQNPVRTTTTEITTPFTTTPTTTTSTSTTLLTTLASTEQTTFTTLAQEDDSTTEMSTEANLDDKDNEISGRADLPSDVGKYGHDNTGEFETGFTKDEMNSTFPDYESYLDWRRTNKSETGDILREPLTDNSGKNGSLITIILVVVAAIGVTALGAAGGFVYMRKKRGFTQVVSMQKLKESGVAGEGFLFDDVNSSIHANNMPNPIIMEK